MELDPAKYLFMSLIVILTFLPLFHNNILLIQVDPQIYYQANLDHEGFEKAYWELLKIGNKIGLGTHWTMYSDISNKTDWMHWEVLGEGKWVQFGKVWFSPEYYRTRNLLWDNFFEFKRAKAESSLRYYVDHRRYYAQFLCRGLQAQGQNPEAVRGVLNEKYIPALDEIGDWHPLTAKIDNKITYEQYPCVGFRQ